MENTTPGNGDGNRDGVQDAHQDNMASMPIHGSNEYINLESPGITT